MGKTEFKLLVKRQGEPRYKEIDNNSFGNLPDFNFEIELNLTPTAPKGRPSFNSEEDDDENEEISRKRKRKLRSPDNSPPIIKTRKPKINDMSYDNPQCDTDKEDEEDITPKW